MGIDFTVYVFMLSSKCSLPLFKFHFLIPHRLQVKEEESGSSVSLSVTFSNLLTTSKTLNTPKNTGTTHTEKLHQTHKKKLVLAMQQIRAENTATYIYTVFTK